MHRRRSKHQRVAREITEGHVVLLHCCQFARREYRECSASSTAHNSMILLHRGLPQRHSPGSRRDTRPRKAAQEAFMTFSLRARMAGAVPNHPLPPPGSVCTSPETLAAPPRHWPRPQRLPRTEAVTAWEIYRKTLALAPDRQVTARPPGTAPHPSGNAAPRRSPVALTESRKPPVAGRSAAEVACTA